MEMISVADDGSQVHTAGAEPEYLLHSDHDNAITTCVLLLLVLYDHKLWWWARMNSWTVPPQFCPL